jgi:hypothetical protein
MLTHGVATPFRELNSTEGHLSSMQGKLGHSCLQNRWSYYCTARGGSRGQGGKTAENFLPDNRKVRLPIVEWLGPNNRLHRINRHLPCPRELASLKRERHILSDRCKGDSGPSSLLRLILGGMPPPPGICSPSSSSSSSSSAVELGFLSPSRNTQASYTIAFAGGSCFIDGEIEAQEVTYTRVSK